MTQKSAVNERSYRVGSCLATKCRETYHHFPACQILTIYRLHYKTEKNFSRKNEKKKKERKRKGGRGIEREKKDQKIKKDKKDPKKS